MSGKGVCEKQFTIRNKLGLHARPASLFVQTSSLYDSEITVTREGSDEAANGKSLMSMLILSAARGTVLRVRAEGPDAEEAVLALGDLINRGFDED